MSTFALLPDSERAALIGEAAARLAVSQVIIEKDFWVCWVLGRIFSAPNLAQHVVFKGGTSLSKVFGAIKRFSEDVDLSLAPALLGFDESALDDAPSKAMRSKRFAKLETACAACVKGDLRDKLEREVQIALGRPFGAGTWLTYELDAIS